jgi:phosphotriesterase-related protein
MAEELELYKQAGGVTLVDVTPMACGRNPQGLADLSRQTGVKIVMGTSWYRSPYYPDFVNKTTTSGLTAILLDEIESGFEGSGVRPGIIGEIGTDKRWMQGNEERVFRASARAAIQSGLSVTTHTPPHCAMMFFDLLTEEKMDPKRIIFGHMDNTLQLDYMTEVLKLGSTVELDLIGLQHLNTDRRRAELVVKLIKLGYLDQILLSMDVYTRPQLATNEGLGYGYLITSFLPRLRELGVTEEEINVMTHKNPARHLEV